MSGIALMAAAVVIQACSDSPKAQPVEAGAEVDSGQEAAAADLDAATCDLSKNLLDDIPDAEIADGATTSGICVSCLNSKCTTQVATCNAACACKGAAGKGLDCYLKNPESPVSCIGQFTSGGVDPKTTGIAFGLLNCVNANCKEACATANFTDAGDAGE